jgi:citrate synthase
MSLLKEKLASQIPHQRERIQNLLKNYGKEIISDISVEQMLGGLRGVKSLLCDTSEVVMDQGLIIRGYPIRDLANRFPEEVFWLLLTGELPSSQELEDLQSELRKRSKVPQYLWSALKTCLVKDEPHPMTMLISCIAILERESKFHYHYTLGMKREEYWEYALEDSLDIIAMLPSLAAGIYRLRFDKGHLINSSHELDWAGNLAHMMGIEENEKEFADLMRLFMVLHIDHDGGNVSANACHVIGSTLSDPYYAVMGGLAGLAGPLHGFTNQEGIRFVLDVLETFKDVPTDEELKKYVMDTLTTGRVIPGYGHPVLRVTDPRFTAFYEYGKKVMPDEKPFRVVEKLFKIVPPLLKELGKVKNPWPNIDASSGVLLYHYGIEELDYYTLLFGVSRTLGLCAQLILDRGMGFPITRPKSVTTDWLVSAVQE